jgi:hypothetical protein
VSQPNSRRTLLVALLLLALAALAMHALVHPVFASDKAHPGQTVFRGSFVMANLLPLIDLVVVTGLFLSRRTAALGYLLNGMIVIYGTVLMGHFGIVGLLGGAPTPADLIRKSLSIDIAIVWVDFLIGKALYESWMRET